jgi:hypothetical protein
LSGRPSGLRKEREVSRYLARTGRRSSNRREKFLNEWVNQTIRGEREMETAELGNAWTESAKRAVELYVESGEKVGKMMLELHERSTNWAKETMLAPLFEAQRSAGKQMIETSAEMARKLYGIGKSNGI